jgi:rubredoxin
MGTPWRCSICGAIRNGTMHLPAGGVRPASTWVLQRGRKPVQWQCRSAGLRPVKRDDAGIERQSGGHGRIVRARLLTARARQWR